MSESYDFSSAYPQILVLFGTRTGNTEKVARSVAEMLQNVGFEVSLEDMAGTTPDRIANFHQVILCSSTHGEGELPDVPHAFHEALVSGRPDLAHVAYGVIALGDTTYEHFAAAADHFEKAMDACEAVRVIDAFRIDRGPYQDQIREACRWALRCAQEFSAAFSDADATE
jgi:sulfite reductase alpha subunit-like flavoprotein